MSGFPKGKNYTEEDLMFYVTNPTCQDSLKGDWGSTKHSLHCYQPDMSGFPKGCDAAIKVQAKCYQPDMSGFPKGQ